MFNSRWMFTIVLLLFCAAPAAWAQVPTSAQNCANASLSNITGSVTGTYSTYILNLPNGTGSGNALIVDGRDASGNSSALTISDNIGTNTYMNEKSETDSNTNRLQTWVAMNVAAGTQTLTITASPADDYLQFQACEFYNVATSSAIDGTPSGTTGTTTGGTTKTISVGSLGTLVSGDLIHVACEADSGKIAFTWTAGSGQSNITWVGDDFNTTDGLAAEHGVYNATTALNPQFKLLNASAERFRRPIF